MALPNLECTRCGLSLRRAMLLALLTDAGAQTYPDPIKCCGEREHDFQAPVAQKTETNNAPL